MKQTKNYVEKKRSHAQIHNNLQSIHTLVPEMCHDLINQNHHVYANMLVQRNEH